MMEKQIFSPLLYLDKLWIGVFELRIHAVYKKESAIESWHGDLKSCAGSDRL